MSPERLDEDDAADLRAAAARIERVAPAFAARMRREADQMDANKCRHHPKPAGERPVSIWVSVNDSVQALDGHRDDANYRAEGTPALEVDVATTNYHDHVRLAIWSHEANEVDVCALLSPDAVRELCRILADAVNTATCEQRRHGEA